MYRHDLLLPEEEQPDSICVRGWGGRQDWGLPATWGTPHQASRTLGCYNDNLCFLQPLKQSIQESLREPNFVNKDSIFYWKKPPTCIFLLWRKCIFLCAGVGAGGRIITFSKKEKWNKSTRGTTHPRQLVLFVVSTTSLCCVAQLSVFLGQTSALQHLHLTLEKVRIRNTFLCQVFSFAKAVCFTEPPPAAGSLWGDAISLWLVSQCRTAASQPGRAVRGTGQCCTLQLCLQLPHQLPSSTLPAWLRAAPAARDRSNGRRRRRRRREGRACLQFTSQNSPRSSCKFLKVLTGHPFVIWSSNRYMYPPKIHID